MRVVSAIKLLIGAIFVSPVLSANNHDRPGWILVHNETRISPSGAVITQTLHAPMPNLSIDEVLPARDVLFNPPSFPRKARGLFISDVITLNGSSTPNRASHQDSSLRSIADANDPHQRRRLRKRTTSGFMSENRPSYMRDVGEGIDCGVPPLLDCTAILVQLARESQDDLNNKRVAIPPHNSVSISTGNCYMTIKNYDDIQQVVTSVDVATALAIMIGKLHFYDHSYGGTMASHNNKIYYVMSTARPARDNDRMIYCVREGSGNMWRTPEPHSELQEEEPVKQTHSLGNNEPVANFECGEPHRYDCGNVLHELLGIIDHGSFDRPMFPGKILYPRQVARNRWGQCQMMLWNDSESMAEYSDLDVLVDSLYLAAETYRYNEGSASMESKGCCLRVMLAHPRRMTYESKLRACANPFAV